MERRAVLRDLLLIAGGITMLPACLDKTGQASVKLKNVKISADQEEMLAVIADTIIPKTDTPGAREVGSHLFVMKMLDDCYETGVQQKFITGMDMLEEAANKKFGNSFVRCTGVQKKQMLQSIEKKENFSTEVYDFYTIMKDRTIEGYMTSKYVVMDIMKAELIPSIPYNGYHLIKNNKS